MKKRFGILLLCLLLIESCMNTQQVLAAVVDNNISNCEVKQYYFFDCDTTDCQILFKEIGGGGTAVPIVSEGASLTETLPDSEAISAEEVVVPEVVTEVVDDTTVELVTEHIKETLSQNGMSEVVEPSATYSAQSIRINEIVSAPETGEKEWIELFNASLETIDLQKWLIEEGAGTKTILSGQIESRGYIVFETKNLNNSGDLILLKDPTGKVIDQVIYGDWDDGPPVDNFLASVKGESLSLYEDTYVVNPHITKGEENIYDRLEPVVENEIEIVTAVSTAINPPSQNTVVSEVAETAGAAIEPASESTPPAYQLSADISINEFLPAPATGAEEWIELYNSGAVDVDLNGWSIDDAIGGSVPYPISESLIIKSKGYLVLPQAKTKLQLNNTGDEVRLLDPNQKVIEVVSYASSRNNISWSKIDAEMIETEILTPGFMNTNPIVEAVETPLISSSATTGQSSDPLFKSGSVSDAAALNLKTQVMVEAAVTVLPGTFSKNIIYVQDETGGIQVYFDAATWPELGIGREVTISGTISQSLGEKRILIKNPADVFVKATSQPSLPFKIDTSMVNQALVGSLVEIEATLFEKDGSTWFITDSAGGVKVYLKKGAQISTTLFNVNEKLKITGVLVQTNGEYLIQPRSEQDIVNSTLADTGGAGISIETQGSIMPSSIEKNVLVSLGLGAAILAVGNLFFVSKKYLSRRQLRGLWYRFKTSLQG